MRFTKLRTSHSCEAFGHLFSKKFDIPNITLHKIFNRLETIIDLSIKSNSNYTLYFLLTKILK